MQPQVHRAGHCACRAARLPSSVDYLLVDVGPADVVVVAIPSVVGTAGVDVDVDVEAGVVGVTRVVVVVVRATVVRSIVTGGFVTTV